MIKYFRICICLLFLFAGFVGFSQRATRFDKYSLDKYRHDITLRMGLAGYYGDFSNNDNPLPFRAILTFGGGIGYSLRIHPSFKLSCNINYLYIQGRDENSSSIPRKARNLSFRNNLIEFNIIPTFPISIFRRTYRSKSTGLRTIFNLDLFMGIGGALTLSNPQGDLNGTWYNLRDYKTEGVEYNPFLFAIPATIGLETRIKGDHLFLNAAITYRYTFTDYLDDLSGRYVIVNDPIGKQLAVKATPEHIAKISQESGITIPSDFTNPGKKRGGNTRGDSYFSIDVGLSFRFGDAHRGRSRKL